MQYACLAFPARFVGVGIGALLNMQPDWNAGQFKRFA
jgi:hypothetical protein